MLSYIDNISITVASVSHQNKIHRLQKTYKQISRRDRRLRVSFYFPKTEPIQWSTPSQRTPQPNNPIELDGQHFHPQ